MNGAPQPLAENIRSYLSIAQEGCEISEWRIKRLLQEVDVQARQAAQALGYYHMSLNKNYTWQENCWRLELTVKPGEAVRIAEVSVDILGEAKNDIEFKKYLESPPIQPGDRLNHGLYESLKSDLSNLAVERGYFDGQFVTSKLKINTDLNRATIELQFDSGRRYYFGEINIEQSIFTDDFINRYIPFEPGDPYSRAKLLELREGLSNSRYFEQITVSELPERTQNYRVPVSVTLEPRKRHSYAVGVGGATDTGPRVKFEYEDRYINSSGHRFSTDLIVSPVRSEINAIYRVPLENPVNEHIDFYSGYLEEDTDTLTSEALTLGSRYNIKLGNNWVLSYFLNYQREDFTVADEEEISRLLVPGISGLLTRTDDPVYPLKGWRLYSQLRTASDNLISDTSFTQLYASFKYIQELGFGRILTRLEAGITETGEFEKLPTSIRFFAGGDNSVRGYDYKDLGPVDDTGQVIGGTNLLVGSLEYDFRVKSRWVMAVFYDQGNAFTTTDVDFKRGAGIGLRWLSPIGPIRIDLATPLDDDQDRSIKLHLSMGPDL
ncbi:MAG TPA: autotransporter assembly complex family protein [Gammaproteobacteria bacterium]